MRGVRTYLGNYAEDSCKQFVRLPVVHDNHRPQRPLAGDEVRPEPPPQLVPFGADQAFLASPSRSAVPIDSANALHVG